MTQTDFFSNQAVTMHIKKHPAFKTRIMGYMFTNVDNGLYVYKRG